MRGVAFCLRSLRPVPKSNFARTRPLPRTQPSSVNGTTAGFSSVATQAANAGATGFNTTGGHSSTPSTAIPGGYDTSPGPHSVEPTGVQTEAAPPPSSDPTGVQTEAAAPPPSSDPLRRIHLIRLLNGKISVCARKGLLTDALTAYEALLSLPAGSGGGSPGESAVTPVTPSVEAYNRLVFSLAKKAREASFWTNVNDNNNSNNGNGEQNWVDHQHPLDVALTRRLFEDLKGFMKRGRPSSALGIPETSPESDPFVPNAQTLAAVKKQTRQTT